MPRLFSTTLAAALLASLPAMAQSLVDPAWLKTHLADPNVLVLDIRPEAHYAMGHVPGAVQADYETAGWRVRQPDGAAGALPPVERIAATAGALGVGDNTHAIVFGDDFAAAARIYWTIKVLGHGDVSVLNGGETAWTAAGGPEETAIAAPHPAPAQWNGTAKTPVVKAFGHLPGAVWIDQTEALTADGATLKPKAALEALFAKVGDGPVIAYCNTGHLSATDWFVLSEVLHHPNTRMYDGSLSQWTADASRPMAE